MPNQHECPECGEYIDMADGPYFCLDCGLMMCVDCGPLCCECDEAKKD